MGIIKGKNSIWAATWLFKKKKGATNYLLILEKIEIDFLREKFYMGSYVGLFKKKMVLLITY